MFTLNIFEPHQTVQKEALASKRKQHFCLGLFISCFETFRFVVFSLDVNGQLSQELNNNMESNSHDDLLKIV